jgi:hypothetical protein
LKNLPRSVSFFILLQFLLLIYVPEARSVEEGLIADDLLHEESGAVFMPDPRKAAMYAAVLPGLGQIYNRRYWKVPIVYAGFAGLAWYTMFTHEEFVRYRNALDFRLDGNPETIDEFASDFRYTNDVLTRFKDHYRRQRDRTVVWTALFYALTIIDATVDAHLFEFDVGDDLGMSLGPSFQGIEQPMAGKGGQIGMGIRLSIKF